MKRILAILSLAALTVYAADISLNPTGTTTTELGDLNGNMLGNSITNASDGSYTGVLATTSYADTKLPILSSNLTITVTTSDTPATILAAAQSNRAYVPADYTVTFDWDDGTHTYDSTLNLGLIARCFSGPGSVRFVGNESAPGSCTISGTNAGYNVVTVDDANVVHYLNGFRISGSGTNTNDNACIYINTGELLCGTNMIVTYGQFGLFAGGKSGVDADYIVASNNYRGVYGEDGSVIEANHCELYGNVIHGVSLDHGAIFVGRYANLHDNSGYGALMSVSSIAYLRNSTITGNTSGGVQALGGSHIDLRDALIDSNGGNGTHALYGSSIRADDSGSHNNGGYGHKAEWQSVIYYGGGTATNDNPSGRDPAGEGNQNSYVGN